MNQAERNIDLSTLIFSPTIESSEHWPSSDACLLALIARARARGLRVGVLTTEEKAGSVFVGASPSASASSASVSSISSSSASSSVSSSNTESNSAGMGNDADNGVLVVACGRRAHLESVAARLYDALRAFDDARPPVDVILSECFPMQVCCAV